jgi:hypothetical protein
MERKTGLLNMQERGGEEGSSWKKTDAGVSS